MRSVKKAEYFEVEVDSLPIRLGQLLKLVNVFQDGMEAKIHIQAGAVAVNAETETRRGRQLHVDDTVTYDGQTFKIIGQK